MENHSKSVIISNKIIEFIEEYKLLEKKAESIYNDTPPYGNTDESFDETNDRMYAVAIFIKNEINNLYYQSVEDNYYFFDCPLSVYKNTYKDRLEYYFKYHIDAEEIDFIKDEIENLLTPTQFCREIFPLFKVYYYNEFFKNYSHFKNTFIKKKEFLIKLLSNFGEEVEKLPIGFQQTYYDEHVIFNNPISFCKIKHPFIEEITTKDVSNKTRQLTSNQIVILFDTIGFFGHPKIEQQSKIKQAKFISLITGLNEKNLNINIKKLEIKPKEVTLNYEKDRSIASEIFDDLTL